EKAEALYEAHGTPNPLNRDDDGCSLLEPHPLTPIDESLFESFVEIGLHPYRAHLGAKVAPGCELCPGEVCHESCKSDARRVCVAPVSENARCKCLDYCEVTRLEADREGVQQVHCLRHGQELQFRAKVFILSAGAYMSPKLLLASHNEHWP